MVNYKDRRKNDRMSDFLSLILFRICVTWKNHVMSSHPDTALNGSSCS